MNSPLNALRGVKGVAAAVRVDVTKRMGGKVKAEKTEKGRREKVMEEVNKMSLMFWGRILGNGWEAEYKIPGR